MKNMSLNERLIGLDSSGETSIHAPRYWTLWPGMDLRGFTRRSNGTDPSWLRRGATGVGVGTVLSVIARSGQRIGRSSKWTWFSSCRRFAVSADSGAPLLMLLTTGFVGMAVVMLTAGIRGSGRRDSPAALGRRVSSFALVQLLLQLLFVATGKGWRRCDRRRRCG